MLIRHKWTIGFCFCLISILCFVNSYFKIFAHHPWHSTEDGEFKVLCLNVHSTGENFEGRSQSIDSLIKSEDPDFVFLTEYHDTCSLVLDSLLRDRYVYGQRGVAGIAYLTECFYSKYPIDSIIVIAKDKESQEALLAVEQDSTIKEHLAHSSIFKCMLSIDAHKAMVYACHLSSNNYFLTGINKEYDKCSVLGIRVKSYSYGSKLRRLEANALSEFICKDKGPVILMGDCNDISGSSVLNRIESAGLEDAWWNGGFGFGNTYFGDRLCLRIDHILYNDKLQLQNVELGPNGMSDHKAVIASFIFK